MSVGWVEVLALPSMRASLPASIEGRIDSVPSCHGYGYPIWMDPLVKSGGV